MKFVEEKRQWETDMSILVKNEKALKEKQAELEKELNGKGKDLELQIILPPAQVNTNSIVQDMSQVGLRYLDIIGLKNQNKNLDNLALKREEERKTWESKCKYLLDKNDKLMKHVT